MSVSNQKQKPALAVDDETISNPFSPVFEKIEEDTLAPLLQRVAKPGRYVGSEFGIPGRDPMNFRTKALLSYPDVYDLGMSNQGLKILYDVIHEDGRFFADRTFLPWPDFATEMQKCSLPLYSLDAFLAASSFDVWGFNIAHELHHTNLLYALDLGGLPLLREDRKNSEPFIICGGTAISNPLPLFDFADGIFMGDGEDAILEICSVIDRGREERFSRNQILHDMQSIDGLVLPKFYRPIDYRKNNGREINSGPEAKKTSISTREPSPYETYANRPREEEEIQHFYDGPRIEKRNYRAPVLAVLKNIPVPNVQISQDRVVIEAARGCGQGCRFCHAGFWKRPVRNSGVHLLVEAAADMLEKTGSDSISLHALSIADYPHLEELVTALGNRFGPDGISLSLPSLRVQAKTIPVLQMTQGIRRSSVTFALEAGSELMRERIRKKSSEENLHYFIREIFQRGWNLVKVYFMLGLPDRENNEIEDLIHSLNALGDLCKECGPTKTANVTISLFVPKPFTTFEWEEQRSPEFFYDAIGRIRSGMHSKRVRLKYPDPWMAYLEGILSRADHRIGPWILRAYKEGAHFDSWDDQFRKDLWRNILDELPKTLKQEWIAKREAGSPSPWHDIVNGPRRDALLRDYNKFNAVTLENMNPPRPQVLNESDYPPELLKPAEIPTEKFQRVTFLRLEYAKNGAFRYISHLDTAATLRKVARRAGLPMTFSRGFNKHEKLHFSEPLPLFFSSEAEYLYIELYAVPDLMTISDRLSINMPPGLTLRDLRLVEQRPPLKSEMRRYRIEMDDEKELLRLESILNQATATAMVPDRKKMRKSKSRRTSRGFSASGLEPPQKERRLASALHAIERVNGSLFFSIDGPDSGAIPVTYLVREILGIPVNDWNVKAKIIRLSSRN